MQEIIIYRNPGEKILWDMISNGQLFPFIIGVVVFILTFIIINKISDLKLGKYKSLKYSYLYVAISFCFGAFITNYLYIW